MKIRLLKRLAFAAIAVVSYHASSAQNYIVGEGGTVLRTDNQGKNFKVMMSPVGTATINSVAIAGQDSVLINSGNQVLRSTDKGLSFTQVGIKGSTTQFRLATFKSGRAISYANFFSTHPISELSSTNFGASFRDGGQTEISGSNGATTFKNANHDLGWVIKGPGRNIYRTQNGGVNFQQVFSTFTFRAVLNHKPDTIIMTGDNGRGFRTFDNGATWEVYTFPGLGTNTAQALAASPTGDTVLAVGDNGYIARSTDGGVTFTQQASPFGNVLLRDLYWKTADTVWLAANGPNNFEFNLGFSVDGGLSFTAIPNSNFTGLGGLFVRNIKSITFSPKAGQQNVGYAIVDFRGNNNENGLIKTTDGGLNWFRIKEPVSNRTANVLLAIDADTILLAYVGGTNYGRIHRSTIGGDTLPNGNSSFVQVNGDNAPKRDIEELADGSLLIAASNGIWRSYDRGATWTLETATNSTGDWFTTHNGWFGGAFTAASSTSDYVNYQPEFPLGYRSGNFRAINALDSNYVFAAGDNGTIFRSTNRGTTWNYIADTSIGDNITGIAAANRERIYAITSTGKVVASIDSGLTWNATQVFDGRLNDIRFKDSVGIIVGNNGFYLLTNDAGQTWTRRYVGTNANLTYAVFESDLDSVYNDSLLVSVDTVQNYVGITVDVPVRVSSFEGVSQLQSSISWDETKLELVGVTALNLAGLSPLNFNTATQANGVISFNWNNVTPQTKADGERIFTLRFKISTNANPQDSIAISFNSNTPLLTGALDSSRVTLNTMVTNGLVIVEESPTITTDGLAATTFCAGDSVDIGYTVAGGDFASNNTFTVLLSDGSGDFTDADTLGIIMGTNTGAIRVALPRTLATGTAYRVNVVADFPVVTGTDNGSNITINALPSTPLVDTLGSSAICEGDNVTLSAPAGFASYAWSNGATSQTITVSDSGVFRVVVTNANGCQSDSSIAVSISVNPLPAQPAVTSAATSYCAGDSVELEGPAGFASYSWSNGATTQNIFVRAGTYSLTVTNANGCESEASVDLTITENPLPATPVLTLTGAANDQITSSVTGTQYVWFYNGVAINAPGYNQPTVPAIGNGEYTLFVISADGCISALSAPLVVTSTRSQLEASLNIYPNPASNQLFVNASALPASGLTYRLMDATGKVVLSGQINESKTAINVGGTASGIYSLQLVNGETSVTKRVVINK